MSGNSNGTFPKSFNILFSFHDQMHLPPPVKDNWGETVFYTYQFAGERKTDTDAQAFHSCFAGNKLDEFVFNGLASNYGAYTGDRHLLKVFHREFQDWLQYDFYSLSFILLIFNLKLKNNIINFNFKVS